MTSENEKEFKESLEKLEKILLKRSDKNDHYHERFINGDLCFQCMRISKKIARITLIPLYGIPENSGNSIFLGYTVNPLCIECWEKNMNP